MEAGWERPPYVELAAEQLATLIEPAFPGRRVAESALLTAGLANTNLRFRLEGDASWYVLRLHTRDARAAERERALMDALAHGSPGIPVPSLLYADPGPSRGEHPYSVWSFVDGTLLAELFPVLAPEELVEIARVCGRVLAGLRQFRFELCGELGPELTVVREYGAPSRFVPHGARELLAGRAGARLGPALGDALWRAVEHWAPRLAAIDGRYTLVHGDYKRSNLLLRRSGASWEVSAVLDWEFAFAGPALIDVGLFLRAGEALPPAFREAFAAGYREAGGELPGQWLALSRLIDVLSQLMFLSDEQERPRRFAESTEVLKETIALLERAGV